MSNNHRVLCFWDVSFDPHVLDGLRQVAEVDVRPPDARFLLEQGHEYDAYLASLEVRFDAEIARRAGAGRMRLVYTPSTGTDHLDLEAMATHGVEMRCIKTELDLLDSVTCTAELALGLMLAAARKVPAGHNAAMTGHWARDLYRGHQLSGKTLGVLGVGRLGRIMVDYGRGFRMNVIGCDPAPLRPVPGLEYLPFEAFAARADVISIHIHLTPENVNFIDEQRLAAMKDGVIIVNTSRGKVIDEAALLQALERGKVRAAGLDVIVGEWRKDLASHPLICYAREHDNLVIVPHLGGVTYEAQEMTQQFVADRLADAIRGWGDRGSDR